MIAFRLDDQAEAAAMEPSHCSRDDDGERHAPRESTAHSLVTCCITTVVTVAFEVETVAVARGEVR